MRPTEQKLSLKRSHVFIEQVDASVVAVSLP
jgi:hypothetical protein